MSAIEQGSGRPSRYLTAGGKRVPSVTTILSRYKESGGLLHWAFQRGKDGAENLYDKTATDIGTLVHSLVEADIHGQPHPEIPPEYEAKVISGYSAWRDWWAGTKYEVIATEVPLVSEIHQFAGALDAVIKTPQGLMLADWKSSNAVYSDYLLQLAAYSILWDECRPEQPLQPGAHLMRFSKEHGDFEHRFFGDLTVEKELFLLLRKAYELDKSVAKRAK
jgi:hypothetical protein